jgi:tetratricopeptide (TPR) repeat protein
MKKLIIVLVLIFCFSCATKKITSQPVPEKDSKQSFPDSAIEEKYAKLLQEGFNKLTNRYTKEAIERYFDPVIEAYNSRYGIDDKQVYCSRGVAETLFYLLTASKKKEDAVVISQLWADAFYLKGYASLDLGKIEDARTLVKKAVELSPSNSMYLSELGHLYQIERKWNEALDLYKRAEEAATAYSPEKLKNEELTRALRGSGYCLIELGRFDEAEKKYKKCLEINPSDAKSLNELNYIQSLRSKKNSK